MGGEKTAQNLAEFKHLSQQGERKKQSSVMIHCIHSREEKKKILYIKKKAHRYSKWSAIFHLYRRKEREDKLTLVASR